MVFTKMKSIERTAFVFNIQKYNTYDGPGVRTLVFFKGCPLRCKWCSNPEGLEKKFQVMFNKNLCQNCGKCVSVCPVNIHTVSSGGMRHEVNRGTDCIGCRACEEACLASALSVVGEVKTVSELLEIVETDKMFYDVSGGGVTLGGGEVGLQAEAAANLLMACKQSGINTAIETCGYGKLEAFLKLAEFTDLFLFDIKHIDSERHFKFTGVRNELILQNLQELLHRRYNVLIRLPLLKDINDSPSDIESLIKFLLPFKEYKNFKGVNLLPYHKMGISKYEKLDLEYALNDLRSFADDELNEIESMFNKYDFSVSVIRH